MKTRKELKDNYKQQQPVMGVFQVKNMANGKVLIEGSTDIPAKWNRHQMELKLGNHRNRKLQKDWNEFKAENFSFQILAPLEYKEESKTNYGQEVKVLEEMVIEELKIQKEIRY